MKLVLADLNSDDPKSKDYYFDVLVKDNSQKLDEDKVEYTVDLPEQAVPIKPQEVKQVVNVTIEAPDSTGLL